MGLHAHTEGEEKKEYLTTNSIRSWAKGNTTLIFQFMNVDNVNSINNHNIKKIKKKTRIQTGRYKIHLQQQKPKWWCKLQRNEETDNPNIPRKALHGKVKIAKHYTNHINFVMPYFLQP